MKDETLAERVARLEEWRDDVRPTIQQVHEGHEEMRVLRKAVIWTAAIFTWLAGVVSLIAGNMQRIKAFLHG